MFWTKASETTTVPPGENFVTMSITNPTSANKLILHGYHWHHSRQIFQLLFVINKKLRIGCFYLFCFVLSSTLRARAVTFTLQTYEVDFLYTCRQISADQFSHWVCKRSLFKTHQFQMARFSINQKQASKQAI